MSQAKLIGALFTMLLCSCGGDATSDADVVDAAGEEAAEAEPEVATPEPEQKPFDAARYPLSDATLGGFPYLEAPAGYGTTAKLSSQVDVAVFPFWVGDHYIAVEGTVYQANLRADDGKVFSSLELEQGIEERVLALGGVKVSDMVVPRAASAKVMTRAFTSQFSNGLCWPSEPVRTYLIRRTDRDIWIHACTYGGIGGAWIMAERLGPVPETATAVVDEARLRNGIDAEGRVDVSILFESDSDRMLSGSQGQITEIVRLLESDPSLSLAVNGHTDDSGDADRNLTLSRQRAQKVLEALVARGVTSNRLRAHGFGRSKPVASNATASGRAANRRVELERI